VKKKDKSGSIHTNDMLLLLFSFLTYYLCWKGMLNSN